MNGRISTVTKRLEPASSPDARSVFPMKPAIPSTAQPNPELTKTARELAIWGAVFVGHVVLALLMQRLPMFGLLHALGTVAIGVLIAARRPLHETAYVVAYIAGSEVLWRMTRAGVFWEYGKYAVALVCLVALVRVR